MDYMREEVHKLAQESRVLVANYCQRAANFVHSLLMHIRFLRETTFVCISLTWYRKCRSSKRKLSVVSVILLFINQYCAVF